MFPFLPPDKIAKTLVLRSLKVELGGALEANELNYIFIGFNMPFNIFYLLDPSLTVYIFLVL